MAAAQSPVAAHFTVRQAPPMLFCQSNFSSYQPGLSVTFCSFTPVKSAATALPFSVNVAWSSETIRKQYVPSLSTFIHPAYRRDISLLL